MATCLALVGRGRWGKNYISTIKQMKGCELKIIVTTNYKKLFNRKDIDGVIIATPSKTHFKIASAFTKHGFNILVEKPLTHKLDEAKHLKKLNKLHKNQISVGQIYMYNPGYQRLKGKVKSVGQIKSLKFVGTNKREIKQDLPALWEWGVHAVSLIYDLMGMPKSVKASINQHDKAVFELIYKNGVNAEVDVGWKQRKRETKLLIKGSRGNIAFDDSRNSRKGEKSPLQLQIEAFVKSIKRNKPTISSIDQALKVTEILSWA